MGHPVSILDILPCCRFNSVDAADYTPPQRRAVRSKTAAAAAASGTSGSGCSLVAPLISIDMCRYESRLVE